MYQVNPYLESQANALRQQSNNNLMTSVLPQVNSGAVAAGGFGGSRQGIAQGLAIGQANQGLDAAIARMYGDAHQQERQLQSQMDIASMQDATARRGQDQSYNLGFGNLGVNAFQAQTQRDLGFGGLANQRYGMDQNFYTAQRGLDQSGMRLGADLFQMGNQGLAGQGQGLYNAGLGQYNAGLMPYQAYGNMLSPFTGYGNSNTMTTPGGNLVGNAIGGGLAGAQFGNLFFRP